MIYKHVTPSPILGLFVEKYLLIHYQINTAQAHAFKAYPARPEQYMTFTPIGQDTRTHKPTGQVEKIAQNAIFSQGISRYDMHPSSDFLLFRVYFRPGALFQLFNIPLDKFTDTYIDTQSIMGSEIRSVNEQLGNTTDYSQMTAIVENFLLQKIKFLSPTPSPVSKIARLLLTTPDRFPLDWLADQACLSPRQFNRKFTEQMGVGPKLYARIVRYYQAFQFRSMNPDKDWLTIALQYGFTDVQHLNKDFRQFAGVTPNHLMSDQKLSHEKVLGLV